LTRVWVDSMQHSAHPTLTDSRSAGLDSQIAAMETLRQCLEDEHRALQVRDPEQLLSIAERKSICLNEAARIDRQHRELEAGGATQTPIAADKPCRKQREQLDTLTRVCRDLNVANGSLISRQKTRIEKTLQIMRGEPDRSDVYGPSGATPGRGLARRLLASI